MFSDNEKISLRQLKRLLVFDLFAISSMIIPGIAAAASGRDGILSILLALVFAFLYVWILIALSNGIQGTIMEYSGQSAGRIITFSIGVLFIVKLFACCVFAARLFGDIINQTLLEDTDHRIIIIMLLAVSAYAASKGFETRARIAEVLFYIVIIPVLLFLLLGLKDIDWTNLLPLFTEDAGDIVRGGYQVFLTFSMLELLLFTIPLISRSRSAGTGDLRRGSGLFRNIMTALLIVSLLNILFFIVTAGILGVEDTKQKLWSSVTIMQIVKMPGGFVQRQDAFILAIWMLSIFTVISGFFYYMVLTAKHIFRVSTGNWLLILFVLFVFGASVIPIDTETYFSYFQKYMMYIGMPQSVLLPALIVFLGKCRKLRKGISAKTVFLVFILASAFSLNGCSDMTEIEDRNFVQAMGIDLKDSEIKIFYQLPDLKALTEQGSAEKPEKLVVELTGKDFWEIEEKYSLKSNTRLDFSHLKAIVFGKPFAEDAGKLEEFLQYVKNNYELGRNTHVFLSKTEAKDILSMNGDLDGGVGDFLDRLYRINLQNSGKPEATIGDMIRGVNSQNTVVQIPVLNAGKKTVEAAGLDFFDRKHLVFEADEEEEDYINLAGGYGKNSRLFITEVGNEAEGEGKTDDAGYVIKIGRIYRKLDYSWSDGKPYLSFKIDGEASVEKGVRNVAAAFETISDDSLKEAEIQCEEQIKKHIGESLEEIMKGNSLDFLNLYRLTSYKNRRMWLDYKGKEDVFMKDLLYSVNVDLDLSLQ